MLPQRSERAAHPWGPITSFARCAAFQERDLADSGASSGFVFTVARKVVEGGVGAVCLSGCDSVAGPDRKQGGFGAGVSRLRGQSGRAEGGLGLGTFTERVQ